VLGGALEGIARDVFVSFINANPRAARSVVEHPSTRAKFDLKGIPVERRGNRGAECQMTNNLLRGLPSR